MNHKYSPNKALAAWVKAAWPETLKIFEALARTTIATYRQWLTGRRRLTPEKAAVIETATRIIADTNPESPILTRGELCETCRSCPYYQIAIKSRPPAS